MISEQGKITGMNPRADKHPSMGYKLRLRAPDQKFHKLGGMGYYTLRLRRDCSTTHFRNGNASLTNKKFVPFVRFVVNNLDSG